MELNIDPIKKWFGYNRKERRASFILIILIVLVLSARMFVPPSKVELTDVSVQYLSESGTRAFVTHPSFQFDPNTASYDTLLLAGLGERQARTLISYRNKGGRFRKPDDIKKLYGIDSVDAQNLIHHISIPQDTLYNIRYRNSIKYRYRKPVELNRCDSAMLEKLPGIGPVLSARIIRYRNLLGGFASADQLKEVYGLPPETFEMIRTMVYADSSLLEKMNINTADYITLTKIPYLRRYHLTDILKFRELEGKISSMDELVENNIIPDSLAIRIKPYVVF